MQATIPIATLRAAAKMASSVAMANGALPINAYVHMEAKADKKGERIVFQAFDGDVHWTGSCGGVSKVAQPGVAVVRADALARLAGGLGAHDVELRLADSHLLVQSGRSRNRLATLPVELWPAMSMRLALGTKVGSILARDLLRIIAALGSFCDPDPKTIVHTLRLASAGERLVEAAATDGYRAAITRAPGELHDELLLTARQRAVIGSYLKGGGEDDDVLLATDGRAFTVQVDGNSRITCRCMAEAGKFPPYQKIIPPTFQASLDLDAGELKRVLQRAMFLAKDQSTANKIIIHPLPDGLRVTASTQLGLVDEEIQGTWLDQPANSPYGYNCAYLIDAIAHMEGQVRWSLLSEKSATTLVALGPDGEATLTSAVMPVVLRPGEVPA